MSANVKKISPVLDGAEKRKENSEARKNSYSENMDNNDMMSAKSMLVFLMSLFKGLAYKPKTNDEAFKELIQKTNEKKAISDEEAIKFINSPEFEKLNKKLEKPFTAEEKKTLCAYVELKDVKELNVETILGLQEKGLEMAKDKSLNETKDNIASAVNSKIHRNMNRNNK